MDEERFARLLKVAQEWLDAKLIDVWLAKRINGGIGTGFGDG